MSEDDAGGQCRKNSGWDVPVPETTRAWLPRDWYTPEVEARADQWRPLSHDDERDDGETVESEVARMTRAVRLRDAEIPHLHTLTWGEPSPWGITIGRNRAGMPVICSPFFRPPGRGGLGKLGLHRVCISYGLLLVSV